MRRPYPRFSAFTLLELVLASALSAVLISMGYAGLRAVQQQRHATEHRAAAITQVSTLQRVLAGDVQRAGKVERQDNVLLCHTPDGLRRYEQLDSCLLRTQAQLTDTFAVVPIAVNTYLLGAPCTTGQVDEISMQIRCAGDTFVVQAAKPYSAEQLLTHFSSP